MFGDSVDAWMASANRYPLLSAAQEIHLSQLIRKALDSDNPSPSEQRAGRRAQHRLMQCNLRLVAKRVFSYSKMITARRGSIEDALQEATIGLNRACELFNPERGYKFSTYAVQWIDQGIRRYVQFCCDVIRKPASANDIHRRWRYRPIKQSLEDFCEQWGYKPERVLAELQQFMLTTTASLDQRVKQVDDMSDLGSLLSDPASEIDLEDFDRRYAIEALEDALPADLELIKAESNGMKHKALAEFVGCKPGKALQRELAAARERLQSAYHGLPAIAYSEPESCQNVGTPCLELVPDVSLNGHQSLEQEAAAVIAEVQAEAEPKAEPQRKRRGRRTKAEIAAAKPPALMTVIANGVELTGPPEVVASLVLQMSRGKAS